MRVTAQLNDSSFLTWHHLPDSNPNQDYCQRSVGSWLIGATLIVCLPQNMCQLHFAGGQIFTKKKKLKFTLISANLEVGTHLGCDSAGLRYRLFLNCVK